MSVFRITYEAEVLVPTQSSMTEDEKKLYMDYLGGLEVDADCSESKRLEWLPGKEIVLESRRSRSKLREFIERITHCCDVRNIQVNGVPVAEYYNAVEVEIALKGRLRPGEYGKICDTVFSKNV